MHCFGVGIVLRTRKSDGVSASGCPALCESLQRKSFNSGQVLRAANTVPVRPNGGFLMWCLYSIFVRLMSDKSDTTVYFIVFCVPCGLVVKVFIGVYLHFTNLVIDSCLAVQEVIK